MLGQQNNHHDIDCCENNRGVDKLFNNYQKDFDLVNYLMINNPDYLIHNLWTYNSPLSVDINCRCQMGEGNRRSSFSCSQCKNISKIKDLRKSEPTFKIQHGSKNGKNMILLPREINNLSIYYDSNMMMKAKSYLSQHKSIINNTNNKCKFICSDPFTNRVLIMSGLTKIFSEKRLPHTLYIYNAFICGNTM